MWGRDLASGIGIIGCRIDPPGHFRPAGDLITVIVWPTSTGLSSTVQEYGRGLISNVTDVLSKGSIGLFVIFAHEPRATTGR